MLFVGLTPGLAEGEPPSTYVWLFSATGEEVEGLVDMVTEEFEEATIKTGCVPVVKRRNLPELESHQRQERERRIESTDFLSPREQRLLRTERADAVVFGKITDDLQGGQIKIAITLDLLSGVSLASTSVRINRGKRFDAEERERRIAELASDLCRALGLQNNSLRREDAQDSGRREGSNEGGGTEVKKAQGYEFTLKECSASGSDLECRIMVRNTRERRRLSVMGKSRLIDHEGITHYAELIESDGNSGGSLFINVDLPTNVPGRFGLRFKGLGGYVKEISLLDVDASAFNVEWLGVAVQ